MFYLIVQNVTLAYLVSEYATAIHITGSEIATNFLFFFKLVILSKKKACAHMYSMLALYLSGEFHSFSKSCLINSFVYS